MQSRKSKPEPNITEAAEKTGLLIRGLQSRLLEGAAEVLDDAAETNADLEKQLQEYFTGWPSQNPAGQAPLIRIRNRVVDGVAERILNSWQQDGKNNPIEGEVIERLIDDVFELVMASGAGLGRIPRSFSAGPKSVTTQLPGTQMQARSTTASRSTTA